MLVCRASAASARAACRALCGARAWRRPCSVRRASAASLGRPRSSRSRSSASGSQLMMAAWGASLTSCRRRPLFRYLGGVGVRAARRDIKISKCQNLSGAVRAGIGPGRLGGSAESDTCRKWRGGRLYRAKRADKSRQAAFASVLRPLAKSPGQRQSRGLSEPFDNKRQPRGDASTPYDAGTPPSIERKPSLSTSVCYYKISPTAEEQNTAL